MADVVGLFLSWRVVASVRGVRLIRRLVRRILPVLLLWCMLLVGARLSLILRVAHLLRLMMMLHRLSVR